MGKIVIGCGASIIPEVWMLTGVHGYIEPRKTIIAQSIVTRKVKVGNYC